MLKVKIITIKIIMFVIAIDTFVMGIYRLFINSYLHSFLDFALFISIIAGFFHLYKNNRAIFKVARILLFLGLLLVLFIIITLISVETRFMWLVLSLFLIFFIFDLKEDKIWFYGLLTTLTLFYFTGILQISVHAFANNGQEAFEKFQQNNYDIILMDMDMHMPVMGGIEATKLIRQSNSNIPIIALTAAVMKEEIEQTKEAGINAHVAKPFDINVLLKVMKKYLTN